MECLNFVHKYIQAVTLADIATIDGYRIYHLSFEAQASNGLCDNTDWPKAIPILQAVFIALWQKAIIKLFISSNLGIWYRLHLGLYLGDSIDPKVEDKWVWWISPLDDRMYKRKGNNWLLYVKRFGC